MEGLEIDIAESRVRCLDCIDCGRIKSCVVKSLCALVRYQLLIYVIIHLWWHVFSLSAAADDLWCVVTTPPLFSEKIHKFFWILAICMRG
jgi:hypothetical protein